MNKKGFTLIELIGVIIILAAITIFAIPPILDSINKSKDNISESTKRIIYEATDLFISDYMGEIPKLPDNSKLVTCIPINYLVRHNYLSDKIYNENNQSGVLMSDVIEITILNGSVEKRIVKDGECIEEHTTPTSSECNTCGCPGMGECR